MPPSSVTSTNGATPARIAAGSSVSSPSSPTEPRASSPRPCSTRQTGRSRAPPAGATTTIDTCRPRAALANEVAVTTAGPDAARCVRPARVSAEACVPLPAGGDPVVPVVPATGAEVEAHPAIATSLRAAQAVVAAPVISNIRRLGRIPTMLPADAPGSPVGSGLGCRVGLGCFLVDVRLAAGFTR
ncbi:hypothetical protein FAIPA1_200082 [Frankia sp. AiPs1]